MTFEEKFAKIAKMFDKAVTDAVSENFAIQVNLSDDDCHGTFYIAYIDNNLAVEPYDYKDNTATITLDSADFVKLVERKIDEAKLIADGKMSMIGNMAHVKAITALIPEKKKTVRKAAAAKKKACAKKCEPAKKAEIKEEKKAEAKVAAIEKKEETKPSVKASYVKKEKK